MLTLSLFCFIHDHILKVELLSKHEILLKPLILVCSDKIVSSGCTRYVTIKLDFGL